MSKISLYKRIAKKLLRYTLYLIPYTLLLIGCSKILPVDTGTGTGRGIVRRIDFEHHLITLEHGRVVNLLNPMTFSYAVKSDDIMRPLHEGDTVAFTIQENPPGEFRVLSLKRVHPDRVAPR
jgi:Cu/Ag efflux protein CusF